MHLACESGNINTVKFILSAGKIKMTVKSILELFLYKIFFRHFMMFKKIISIYGITKKHFHETILFPACKSGNIELVKYLLSFDKIDIKSESILLYVFLIMFLSLLFF